MAMGMQFSCFGRVYVTKRMLGEGKVAEAKVRGGGGVLKVG
jgi:hypothetical protein